MRKYIAGFVLLFGFWLLLSFTLDPGLVVVGVIATVLALVLIGGKAPRHEWLLNPVRLFWLLVYIPYFSYYCLKANLDVAYRVLHPDMPIRPGIVKVTTDLQTKLGKMFLANSITLTPGTLAVDCIGQDLYVHCIYVHSDDPREQTEQIVKVFEGLIKRIFE
jgi:multicomponent Na+:H+ antiporter subunit E